MTSQINPNNIDGNYPVPGVPNNTQGFRSNFTETATNFQYAADEITDLQNKVVLKQALAGTTLNNNMNDGLISAVKLNDVSYTYLPITTTSGSIAIDYSAATFQQISTAGSVSLSFTNFPASGSAGSVRVGINITNVAHTVTLPASVSQGIATIGGVSPGTPGVSNTITFGAVGNYAFEFVSIDGGTTIWIFDDSRDPGIVSTPIAFTNTTVSTSTTTGAVVITGGVGIGGNLNVGGISAFSGNVTGGNLITGGLITATGGITSTANVTGGNISTAGLITATGNIAGGNISTAGLITATGNIAGGNITTPGLITCIGVASSGNIASSGRIQSTSPSGGVGYATGSGGTVSQSGNKSTGVTLNTASGQITMQNTNLAADTSVSFTLTNSNLDGTDLMILNHVSGGTAGAYVFNVACNSGSAVITVRNITAGTLGEAIVLRYAVIKGSIT